MAELLISLAILGVIATFTIPKVLNAQQEGQSNAIAKETAAALANAFDAYRLNNSLTPTTNGGAITPFLNYVAMDSMSVIDNHPTQSSINCSSGLPCMVLHNGAIIKPSSRQFGGLETTNAIFFYMDVDAQYSGSTADSPGKGIVFFLYPNGLLRTRATVLPNTTDSTATNYNPDPNYDPGWFSWD